jgi:L-asparagine oxygenase
MPATIGELSNGSDIGTYIPLDILVECLYHVAMETTTNVPSHPVVRSFIDVSDGVRAIQQGQASGAVLIQGFDVGVLPATPSVALHTLAQHPKVDRATETNLMDVASLLGEPVGYAQEHGGDIVQDLYPLASSVGRQLSTSSGVTLAFHTETAFHPHKPRYLLLLCLKGDPAAATTLCSVDAILELLEPSVRIQLSLKRYVCGVDESFGSGVAWATEPMAILSEDGEFTFDADLMRGVDAEADQVIAAVADAVSRAQTSVTLVAGDLLILDNHRAVHGRSPFTARFDGTDRWLQRTFVVDSLTPSEGERVGRVITTTFV